MALPGYTCDLRRYRLCDRRIFRLCYVFIIEDEAFIAMDLQQLLEQEGAASLKIGESVNAGFRPGDVTIIFFSMSSVEQNRDQIGTSSCRRRYALPPAEVGIIKIMLTLVPKLSNQTNSGLFLATRTRP